MSNKKKEMFKIPSKKPQLKTYTDEITVKKFSIISSAEKRTMSKELEYLVQEKIREYEKEKGIIKI